MGSNKLDFHQLLEAISRRLQAHVDLAGLYAHPSGTGDAREDAIIDVLREILPSRFGVDKGRIFDSTGQMSAEIDLIIYERDEAMLGLEVGGRRFIPVESVYAVIEVKSMLDQANWNASVETLTSIDGLRRFYRWQGQPLELTPENDARNSDRRFTVLSRPVRRRRAARGRSSKVKAGVPATEVALNIGTIWSAIVAYDAVADDTLGTYMASAPNNLVFLCIPGKQFVTKWVHELNGFRGLRIQEKSLGLFAIGVMDLVGTNTRKRYFTPDVSRYRDQFVSALGEMDSWTFQAETSPDQSAP